MPEYGQVTWVNTETDEEVVQWSASDIQNDVRCRDGATYGNLIAIEFEVQVFDAYQENILDFSFSDSDFFVTDEDGSLDREHGTDPVTDECLGNVDQLPDSIPAGTKATGSLVFQVSVEAGTIHYEAPHGALYEWEF